MKTTKIRNTILLGAAALGFTGSASAVTTILASGTVFDSISRINTNVARVGANNNFDDFTVFYVFDISTETFTDGTLNFETNVFSGTPSDLQVDFLGTFTSSTVTLANAEIWDAAPVVSGVAVDPVITPSDSLSLPFTGITGPNDFAVFRITDPTPVIGGNEFDLADATPLGAGGAATFTTSAVAPTLDLVPEPSSVSLIALSGLMLLRRRRK